MAAIKVQIEIVLCVRTQRYLRHIQCGAHPISFATLQEIVKWVQKLKTQGYLEEGLLLQTALLNRLNR